jgi:hypothetical protein
MNDTELVENEKEQLIDLIIKIVQKKEQLKIQWQKEAFDAAIYLGFSEIQKMGISFYGGMISARNAVTDDMGSDKLGRWLGWWQGVICSAGIATMDDFKIMNKRIKEKYYV